MRLLCRPSFGEAEDRDSGGNAVKLVLYGRADRDAAWSAGASVREAIIRKKLQPTERAWDLLSIALSATAADLLFRRNESPDGWTREIHLEVAVADPAHWSSQRDLLQRQLRFLTTDIWTVDFVDGGFVPDPGYQGEMGDEDCAVLLSGGLDSLIGALDLTSGGGRPFAVSQVARGDKDRQARFASTIGGGLRHLQINHNVDGPGTRERSARARSLIFLAYGVLTATSLRLYHDGGEVPLYLCENGFISVNPPLTGARLGSLSTRTSHPAFLRQFQTLLRASGIRVRIENPYQFATKGEMLVHCTNQEYLREFAHTSTSCGRFARYGYRHCGRCTPCLIRRAAFNAWGIHDSTDYVFDNLGQDDENHAGYDDVRAAAMAVAQVDAEGLDAWLGTSVSSVLVGDTDRLRGVVSRGLEEIRKFLELACVR